MYCMCLISQFKMTALNMHFVFLNVLSIKLSACSDTQIDIQVVYFSLWLHYGMYRACYLMHYIELNTCLL